METATKLATLRTVLSIIDSRQRNAEKAIEFNNSQHRNDERNTKVFLALRGEYLARLNELDSLEKQIIRLMADIEDRQAEELLAYFEEIGL